MERTERQGFVVPAWVTPLGAEGIEAYHELMEALGRSMARRLSIPEREVLARSLVLDDEVPVEEQLARMGVDLRQQVFDQALNACLKLRRAIAQLPEEIYEDQSLAALSVLTNEVARWLPRALWPNGASREALSFTARSIAGLMPVEARSRYVTPMNWFMHDMLIPLLGTIERGVLSLRGIHLYPAARMPLFIFVTLGDANGTTRTWKLEPGMIQTREAWERVMSEETIVISDGMNTSSIDTLLLVPGMSVAWLTIKVGQLRNMHNQARTRRVGILPFVNAVPGVDLSRYQVFTAAQYQCPKPGQFKHCLIWALEQAGVATETIQSIAAFIPGRLVRLTGLDKMFATAHLKVEVTYSEPANRYVKRRLVLGDKRTDYVIRLGMVGNHVFLNELTNISLLYVKNCWELPMNAIGFTNIARMNHGVPTAYYDTPQTWSFDIINWMWFSDAGQLQPLSYYEISKSMRRAVSIDEYKVEELKYDKALSTREIRRDETSDSCESKAIWFADYETFVQEVNGVNVHKPYLLCWGHNGEYESRDVYSDHAKGVYEMLAAVKEGIVYFHNLNYDGTLLFTVLKPMEDSIIEYGGTKILAFSVRYEGKIVEFRDSLAILPFALRKFPKMLGIEMEKEIMPYSFYNLATYKAVCPFEDVIAGQSFTPEEFRESATKAGALEDEGVDMWKYAVYYCIKDVAVLEQGFFKMDSMMYEATSMHIWERYTAPSLAYHSLRLKGVFDGCYELTGAPAQMIRRTVVGGRCMLKQNLKQRVTTPVSDFDAVSLYPSAMSVLYTLKGTPKVIPEPWLAPDVWETVRKDWDGYFIEIDILHVGKHLDFPLISYKSKTGGRMFVNECGRLWVDNITLDDLIEFHQVTYKPLRGYYYDEGKNFTLGNVIREIFDLRLKAKREKKAIEQVYKLLMNSCYGKTIMKPRATQKNVMSESELLREICGTPAVTVGFQQLANGNFLVRSIVDVLSNWSFPSLGAQILSMSKRLMSRVMVLAQDMGIGVYYTDTDSIHIDRDAVGMLAEAYAARYHQELIGKSLLQFHTDFPTTARGMMWSKRFIGVGKKAYIDWLTDGTEDSFHIRLKGIPLLSIEAECRRRDISPLDLYDRFFDDPEFAVSFNLCDAKPMFSRKSDFTLETLNVFERRIKFGGLLEPIE